MHAGKELAQLTHELGEKDPKDVALVLDNNDYFKQVDSDVYALSIFCSLRWGVAGVGKIS